MPRRPKVQIKLNDTASLLALYEDIYHDLHTQRNQIIREISIINNSAELEDDHARYQLSKVKTQLFTCLISCINSKQQLAKLLASTLDWAGKEEYKDKVSHLIKPDGLSAWKAGFNLIITQSEIIHLQDCSFELFEIVNHSFLVLKKYSLLLLGFLLFFGDSFEALTLVFVKEFSLAF